MKNTIVSPFKPIKFPEQKTIHEYLLARAKHFADIGRSAYLVDGLSDKKRYFKDFEIQTRKVASHFYKDGLRKGDIAIYMTAVQYDQVLLMTGVWRANGIVRSLYADEDEGTILEKVKESKAKWIFCDADKAMVCQSIAKKCEWPVKVITCGKASIPGIPSFDEYVYDNGNDCPNVDVREDDLALILPTSGTTGASKGAMHSYKSTLAMILLMERFPYSYPKCNLIASKGTHVSGTTFPYSVLAFGGTIVVLPKINKEILIKAVDKYKPGFVMAFPSYLTALASSDAEGYDVTSIEVILTGGSPMTAPMKKAFLSLPNVKGTINAFGMTEGCTVATTAIMSEDRIAVNDPDVPDSSVGKPYPGGEVQIRDIDSGKVLGPNEKGEIWARGDFTFIGYFLNPKATAETKVDGWLRSGDVGYFDNNGYIFVVDRAKDIFKYFHNHISPTELESVISEHPDVKEACVIAVPDEGGEVPRAFVTLIDKKDKDLSLLAKEIKKFADDKLASYKQLRGGLYIIDDLPKGKTGKVTRNLVAQLKV